MDSVTDSSVSVTQERHMNRSGFQSALQWNFLHSEYHTCHFLWLFTTTQPTEGRAVVRMCEKRAESADQVWIAPGVISESAWRAEIVFLFLLVCDMCAGSCDVPLTGLRVRRQEMFVQRGKGTHGTHIRSGIWGRERVEDSGTDSLGGEWVVGGIKGWPGTVPHFPRALTANTNFRR